MAVSEAARKNHEEPRAEVGRAVQEQIVGREGVDKLYASAPPDEAHIQRFLSANCFGDHLARSGIDLRTRELLTFSMLVSLGGCEPQVRGHVAANLNVGNDRARLIDVLTQLLPFIGYPRTLNGLRLVDEVTTRSPNPGCQKTENTMAQRTWLITGVSSGFGRHLTEQLLERGDRVVGTVRDTGKVSDLAEHHPDAFRTEVLDMTDAPAIHALVARAFAELRRIDVIVSNAGYGLFGAAEELTDAQVEHIVATNLLGPIHLVRAALPHLRGQGGGRIVQISSYGGQVAFPGNSLYHATKWGIEGFVESVAQEVASFGIGMTIVEPGGARTEFRYGSAQVATLMPEYEGNPAHAFLRMLDPANGLAPGDPARMATRIIESVDLEPAPLRMVLGSQALESTIATLRTRIAGFEAQTELAASTDYPQGE
ncbi:MAG TPA: SDR family oxidoreductase [Candidatus Limnocylindrales bacterium]|jgi:NAD(P)-dependent dehydrogenase (short-subunit alcohol dehydrogenase family)/alkylhydroperoxidase/carboxymuconolactone decarboxylase family protein YurZ